MCALMKIIHSLNRYVSYARPSSRFCCCCFVASVVSDSFVTPWTVAHQTPLSMGFPRQEYWRGFSFPPPGDLPDPETELKSPALAGGFFTTEPLGKRMTPVYCTVDSVQYQEKSTLEESQEIWLFEFKGRGRKTSISALLSMQKPLTVWITKNVENSERDGNTRTPDLPLEKFVCRSGSNS